MSHHNKNSSVPNATVHRTHTLCVGGHSLVVTALNYPPDYAAATP
jgi:hypothetical protein